MYCILTAPFKVKFSHIHLQISRKSG